MRYRQVVLVFILLPLLTVRVWAIPLRILTTTDMHGFLYPQQEKGYRLGGAAEMLAYWKRVEGYTPRKFLLVSDGDVATGPVYAARFMGLSTIDVMNNMGYDVGTLGNHDLDFGQTAFTAMRKQAHFPILAANLANRDGTPANLTAPYMFYEEQGVKVGIIGLVPHSLPPLCPTTGLMDTPYAAALRKYVPEMRAKGAKVVIVAAHVPLADLVALAGEVPDLKIPLMLGGHDHQLGQQKVGGTWVVDSGRWWHAYSRIDMDFDPQTGETIVLSCHQHQLISRSPLPVDESLRKVLADWQQRLNKDDDIVLGYAKAVVPRGPALSNFILDCWLAHDPTADFAFVQHKHLPVDCPQGVLRKGTIYHMLPYVMYLVRAQLTGKELEAFLAAHPNDLGFSGLRRQGGKYLASKTGKAIEPEKTYRILVNSYLLIGDPVLSTADPQPVMVAADWSQPVIAWLSAHPTTRTNPLERIIDVKPRVAP